MLATVDIADLGAGRTVRTLFQRPRPDRVPGLRWADVAVLAQLASARPPSGRRAALFAFWDDEAAADNFTASHPLAQRFAGGFHARLTPLRAFGSWPGLPADIPNARRVPHEGPVAVLTLGRLRPSQLVRFVRASRPAEKRATLSEGLRWGTASARPPFVATFSIWADTDATMTYAYGREFAEHHNAIAAQRKKDFHRQSAFIRFIPTRIEGALAAPNAVSAESLFSA